MKPMHMNPEEAVTAFLETRCRRAVAMHWGTFRLTDEPLGEPPLRLKAAVEISGLPAGRVRRRPYRPVMEHRPGA